YRSWSMARQATISYGYGVAVTALQLADAYDILADDGMRRPPSFVRLDAPPAGQQVIPATVAVKLRHMLETVVSNEGTGKLADVAGYHVAGKTGTAHIAQNGGYSNTDYISVFAGIAPASDPRLVTIVVIREPSKGQYYAATVAAPVFARVMTGALRLLDIPPDDLGNLTTTAYVVNLGHAS
ncbi:MAG: penicillin-binding transpeptidase domain-containing protein, partial [Gammaproteobacteria bacterium]